MTIDVEIEDRVRLDSQSSNASSSDDSAGFENMEPIQIDDIRCFHKQMFDSITEDDDAPIMDVPVNTIFSVAMALRRRNSIPMEGSDEASHTRAKKNWKTLLKASQHRKDPWEVFHLDELPMENAVRSSYNAMKKTWKTENVVVKIENDPFGRGAMRECFRMKKLSNFSHNQDWTRDCNNYVAKQYLEDVDRQTYFDDVKLQQDAKLWSEEYNRHNPPKPVDIFQMAVLEFPERKGSPLFHVEHFIEGEYIKYNSNSGFVDSALCRQTPHAFSHFSFERSGHELIVVDIQGVGDLYTDPQIHTSAGTEYGDGNLGPKGMALFFHSHQCNDICRSLGLTKFDLTNSEISLSRQHSESSIPNYLLLAATRVRGNEVICESPGAAGDFFPARLKSISEAGDCLSPRRLRKMSSDYFSMESHESPPSTAPIFTDGESDSARSDQFGFPARIQKRHRYSTECSDDSGGTDFSFQDMMKQNARCTNLSGQSELMRGGCLEEPILGQVHLELARYHELCRFVDDGNYDREAALFHLRSASQCGVLIAIITMGRLYAGLPHDILPDVEPPEDESEKEREQKAFAYFEEAADMGDRASMVFVARALDTGLNLGDEARKSWRLAMDWYERICEQDLEDGGDIDCGFDDARYMLLARQAEMWLGCDEDGGLKKEPSKAGDLYNEAAEAAMGAMKGKLANKYYMFAEEAYGQVEDDEEQ